MLVTSAKRWIAFWTALAVAVGLLAGAVPTASARTAHDVTSAVERRRVDSVPTPTIGWSRCLEVVECATVKLPLDYDAPSGPKTEVAVLRRKARDPKRRIGTLFLNPGGPGGSGTEIAYHAPSFLGAEVLARFDIVGFDPRGTNFSDRIWCYPTADAADPDLNALYARPFPYGTAEEDAAIAAYRAHSGACSSTGLPLSAAASTAQVARDMDVLRRAVGDPRLSFLGFSYGSYLGQVYANMFPDRVRVLALDGVLDPLAWSGDAAAGSGPVADRLRAADGASDALQEIFRRCDQAGAASCGIAADGGAAANFALVAERLKNDPLVRVNPVTGRQLIFGYAELVDFTLGALYSAEGHRDIDVVVSALLQLTGDEPRAAPLLNLARAVEGVKARLRSNWRRSNFRRSNFAVRYDNSADALMSVTCTDSLDTPDLEAFPTHAEAADARAPYFGRLWLWTLAGCASPTWTAEDEDSYRGPFDRRTVGPVLVVGSDFDPATNYAGAVRASQLLPNSGLLRSRNFGHTAYGSSSCVTGAVDRYLLTAVLPAAGTVCLGDVRPFAGAPTATPAERRSNFTAGFRPLRERDR